MCLKWALNMRLQSYGSIIPSFFRAAKNPSFGDDVPVLQVAAALVALLDQTRERDAGDVPLREGVLVLAANVLHGARLEQGALVGHDGRDVDAQDGLLDGEEAR